MKTALAVIISLIGSIPAAQATIPIAATDSSAILQQAVAGLNQFKEVQEIARLQNPELSYAMRKALVLADLLFDSNGNLNVGLCSQAKGYFVPANPEEYEANIGRILDQLDATWQSFFDGVKKPADDQNVGNLVLRALLALHPNDALTDRHAKVAVLAAMFAPYNQGPVGDCFAVSDLIRDHDTYYRHSAADYASIVQEGCITRPVGVATDQFFFLPILADSDREKPFMLTAAFTLVGSGVRLLEMPGMVAARNLMGAERVSDLNYQVIKILMQHHTATTQVTIDDVLDACAQVISAETMDDPALLKSLGQYAFSSVTNNPVLRGTECAFAAMAEYRPEDSTRSNINNSVTQALQGIWNAISMSQTASDFQNAFMDNFNASYRLVYNDDIPLAQVSSDGSSTDGGFQLYKRLFSMSIAMGVPVPTPDAFGQLVLDAIAMTASQLGATDDVQSIASTLNDFVQNGTFLRDVLWAYDQANQQESDPVTNYQKLSRTPMQSCDGDNPYEVDDIDTEMMYEGNVQTYTPTNTQDLVTWCLDMAEKVMPGLYPMNSPQHAFNYAPGNADIAAFVKNGMGSDQWIKQMLVIPGMQIATRQIEAATSSALASAVLSAVAGAVDSGAFNDMVAMLNMSPMSLSAYAQGLVDGISQLVGDPSQASQIALLVDGALLQTLSLQDLNMLQKTAIRFAFTNWNDGTKDIYFCAFFNPRTQKISFGSIDEDKTSLQPMDEQAWVNNQQWDVDLSPAAPISLQNVL